MLPRLCRFLQQTLKFVEQGEKVAANEVQIAFELQQRSAALWDGRGSLPIAPNSYATGSYFQRRCPEDFQCPEIVCLGSRR